MLDYGHWLACLALFTLTSAAAVHSQATNQRKAVAQGEARLAIIIDDIGYNQSQSERAARLKGAFTLSILPFTPHSAASARLAHQQGKELMLHLPMSAINNAAIGKGGLVNGMDKTAFLTTLRQDLANVPHIRGVNNHMGSRLTQDAEPMGWLMEELHPRGLYFVDSRTSPHTKALDIATSHAVPSLKRDVFLDDVKEPNAIEFQLNRALQIAKQKGFAVAIGHPYPATLAVLERIQPLLAQKQVKLVYVSDLLKPRVSRAASADHELILTTSPIASPFLSSFPLCPAPSAGLLPQILTPQMRTSVDFYDKPIIMNWRIFGY